MSTTNSTTSFGDKEARQVLTAYLEGLSSLGEVQDKLKGHLYIDFDLSKGQREIRNLDMPRDLKIPVATRHVQQMLRQYLDHKVSNKEISDWAAFVSLLPFYEPEGETEEEREQNGEGMAWEIIQWLSHPSSVISLNSEKARGYLERL